MTATLLAEPCIEQGQPVSLEEDGRLWQSVHLHDSDSEYCKQDFIAHERSTSSPK